jgi:[ribosomal protein S18]-alanine N-acetyltransferase
VDVDSLQIRRATLADLAAICDIEVDCFTWDCFNRRQFRYLMSRGKSAFWVAVQGTLVAGYSIQLLPSRTRLSRIYSLATSPAFQGRGIGRMLLKQMEDHAQERGYEGLKLEVRVDNTAATRAYLRFGLRATAIRKKYYEDGCDAAIYVKYFHSQIS